MADFLFHRLSDKEKEDVKKEAKKILESFSKRLSKAKVPEEESVIEREGFERVEGPGLEGDEDFRKRILENAQNKNKDFIIAEKKRWE